jgi:excisionase family DNA binding protein
MSQFGPFVTVSEAARLTNQTYWQIRRLIQKKSIEVQKAGNTVLVRLVDVARAAKEAQK